MAKAIDNPSALFETVAEFFRLFSVFKIFRFRKNAFASLVYKPDRVNALALANKKWILSSKISARASISCSVTIKNRQISIKVAQK